MLSVARSLLSIVLPTALGLAQAQTGAVHVVQNGVNLQNVVDAAASGDTLLIRAGNYPTGATIDGKGLTLVADGPGAPLLSGGVRVSNLAPDERVVLSGLQVLGEPWTGLGTGRGLAVASSAGSVRADRCSFSGREVGHAAALQGPFGFVATGCQFQGGNVASYQPSSGLLFAGSGLVASGGSQALFGSFLRGADALDAATFGDGQWGGTGAAVGNSRLHAASSTFQGGRGGRPSGACTFGGNGGDGLQVNAPWRVRAVASTFTAGAGALGNNCFCAGCFNGEPGVAMNGPVTTWPGPTAALYAPRIAREGTAVNIDISTQTGARVFLVASQHVAHDLDLAYNGPLLVRGPYELRLALGATGSTTVPLTLPMLPPGVESQTWFFQVIVRLPTSGAWAGECRPLVIVDDAF